MTLILYVFALILSSALRVCVSDSNTVLAIKRGVENHSIAIGATTYLELVKKSTIFVDNTLFIDELLKTERRSDVMLCPRKWGKTMLLDMLKTFLEIKVDEKGAQAHLRSSTPFKLFRRGVITSNHGHEEKLEKPLLIAAKTSIMNEYQGQYPVVYVSFKNAVGRNFNEIIQRLRIKISEVFNQHKYMLYVLQKQNLFEDVDHFERLLYPNATSSISEFTESLKFLCQILNDHFKKRVFVLIDDYDASFQSLLHLGEVDKCIVGQLQDVFNSLLMSTLTKNHNLERGIAIGTFRIQNNDIEFLNRFHYQRAVFKNQTLLQFFGFSETDVESLFRKFNVTDNLARQARRWYYGHRSQLNNESFYNPWSIVNFLMRKKIDNYWLDNENLDFLRGPIRRSLLMRQNILKFISEQSFVCHSDMRMNKFLITSVKNTLRCLSVNPNKKGNVFFIFWFLMECGFLVKNRDGIDDTVRSPNKEVTSLLAFRLMSYYQQRYHIDQKSLHDTAMAFYHYLKNTLRIPSINETLEKFYQNNRNFANIDTLNGTVENPVYDIFNLLLLKVQCITKFDYEVYYDRIKKANYVIYDNTTAHGAIIEITIDDVTADNALMQAEKYVCVFDDLKEIKTIKCIGINFQSNGKISVKSLMKKNHKIDTNTTTFNSTSVVSYSSTNLNS